MTLIVKLIIIFILIALFGWLMWKIWTPVKLTRVQVLRRAKRIFIRGEQESVCVSILASLDKYGFDTLKDLEINKIIFPELTLEYAKEHGFDVSEENAPYWWKIENIGDRVRFFNHLIEFYKDNEENLYEIYEDYLEIL